MHLSVLSIYFLRTSTRMFSHPAGVPPLGWGGADLLSSPAPTLTHLRLIQADLQRPAQSPSPRRLRNIFCWVAAIHDLLFCLAWTLQSLLISSLVCLSHVVLQPTLSSFYSSILLLLIRSLTRILSCALLAVHVRICNLPCLGNNKGLIYSIIQYEELTKSSNEDTWL